MPKQDGRLAVLQKTLEVYTEHKVVNNELFKEEIRKKVSELTRPSAELNDGPALLKKSEIARYFGLIEYSFQNKMGSINTSGIDFLKSNNEKRIEIIFDRMNNISFGMNNCVSKTSNSFLNPPILFLKAIKEFESLSRKEFSYLLYCLEDKKLSYENVINDFIGLELGAPSHPNENKYSDPKFTVFFNDLGIIYEEEKRFYLYPKYLDYIDSLKIFSNNNNSYNNAIKEKIPILNRDIIIASNNRRPVTLNQNTGRNTYKTDPKLKNKVFMDKNYKCEMDEEHQTFKKDNGIIFMEGHHLIPMKAQKDFDINIDRTENIICLCPNCHRQIHYGNRELKKRIFEKLFLERFNSLRDAGVKMIPKEIFEKYYA